MTRPGVRGGWEASAPACQLSLQPLALFLSHRGGGARLVWDPNSQRAAEPALWVHI